MWDKTLKGLLETLKDVTYRDENELLEVLELEGLDDLVGVRMSELDQTSQTR